MKYLTKRNICIFLLSFLCLHICVVDIDYYSIYSEKNSIIWDNLWELYRSFNNVNFLLFIKFFLLFKFFSNNLFVNNKVKRNDAIFAVCLSFFTIIGKCYNTGSSSILILFKSFIQVYKLLILIISYSFIYYAVICMFKKINFKKIKFNSCFVVRLWEKHPVLYTVLLFLIFWLPFLVIFYPGGATGDTADSIYQFFHSDNSWSIRSINLLNNSVYINKHHSVLFTVILGNFIRFGKMILSNNLGLFLYNLLQFVVLIIVLTYIFNYLKKHRLPSFIILLFILYYCFCPVIIKFSMTAVKDTFSAIFTLIYVLFLLKIITEYNFFDKKSNIFLLIMVMLMVMLFRNNGIYTVLFSYPFLLFAKLKNKKRVKNILLLVLVIFFSYNNILLPSLNVSNGSIREMLSIPFMQIARTIKYHHDDFTEDDINVINKVLDYDIISHSYTPNISDDIKNTYKKDSTKQDNYMFFKLWFKYFKKYPLLYLDSFLNSSYGYYYPVSLDYEPIILVVGSLNMQTDVVFDYVYIFNDYKILLNYWLSFILKNPFFVCFYNVGIIDLILLFSMAYVIRKKKYKYLIPLLPLFSVFLVCLASPINGFSRYILPIYLSLPIVIYIDFLVCKSTRL